MTKYGRGIKILWRNTDVSSRFCQIIHPNSVMFLNIDYTKTIRFTAVKPIFSQRRQYFLSSRQSLLVLNVNLHPKNMREKGHHFLPSKEKTWFLIRLKHAIYKQYFQSLFVWFHSLNLFFIVPNKKTFL